MQTINEINNLLNKEIEFAERRKITSLRVGEAYIIKKMASLTTRFGKAILVTLYDQTLNEAFESFLPKRVVETLAEDTVETMNKSEGKFTLTYLGQSSHVFSGGVTKTLLNFGMLE